MDSLLLIFLLLGAAPDGSSMEAPRSQSRVQAVASATILGGEVIHFGETIRREATKDSGVSFQLAPIRSIGEIASVNGQKIQLQEFH